MLRALRSQAHSGSPAAPLVATMIAVIAADCMTNEVFEALRTEVGVLEERLAEMVDEVAQPTLASPSRFRHGKFGEATLIGRTDDSLRLRFDDGTERVIKERFVSPVLATSISEQASPCPVSEPETK